MPLPLLPLWRWHHCGADIIVNVALALLGHCCCHGAGVIADIALAPLPLLPSWRWHHCGTGIIADIALEVLRPPLHGRQCPPLGPWPFRRLPSAIGTHPGLCPFVVHSSKSISLIALALAPTPTAVRPAFLADYARPLVSAFLANLWVHSTPSKAGSSLSFEMLPALFFCQLSWFRAALFRFWGVTTPASPTPVPASACDTHQHSLRRGWRPPLGLQCPITKATTNSKKSCASAQY